MTNHLNETANISDSSKRTKPIPHYPKSIKQIFNELFSGNFKSERDTFHKMLNDEPHKTRRQQILEKYPEIRKLYTPNPYSFLLALVLLVIQFTVATIALKLSWIPMILIFYFVTATITHTFHCLVHDFTHFTAFESVLANKLAAIVCNFAAGIPFAISFGRYHRDHHMYLNQSYKDPDMPTDWECKTFNTPFKKFLFILVLPLFYTLRPVFVIHKTLDIYEVLNIVSVLFFDYILWKNFGYQLVVYLLLGTFVSIGPHPTAVHIFTEHYEFVKGQDTSSYYGSFNIPNLNLGYHLEHHDFPQIPWTRLPKVREIASEFYNYPTHNSFLEVAIRYVMDKDNGPWSRIDRNPEINK